MPPMQKAYDVGHLLFVEKNTEKWDLLPQGRKAKLNNLFFAIAPSQFDTQCLPCKSYDIGYLLFIGKNTRKWDLLPQGRSLKTFGVASSHMCLLFNG